VVQRIRQCVKCAADHFGIGLTSTFDEDMCEKRLLYFHSHWLWRFDLKFSSLISLVQRYVSTNLDVPMAFLFWENQRYVNDRRMDSSDGETKTDGLVQKLMRLSEEICIINKWQMLYLQWTFVVTSCNDVIGNQQQRENSTSVKHTTHQLSSSCAHTRIYRVLL